jgi:cytochrome c peroxidase
MAIREDSLEHVLIATLIDGWEEADHTTDSLIQVLQSIPDWESRFREAFADPLLASQSREKFAQVRKAVEDVLSGQEPYSRFEQFVAARQRRPQ